MPLPIKGESRQSFLNRYMRSEEAQRDFPDPKRRYTVAVSEWDRRNKNK